jgi:hypothetical protein
MQNKANFNVKMGKLFFSMCGTPAHFGEEQFTENSGEATVCRLFFV